MKDIIQTAMEQENLSVLLSTIQELGLEDILRFDGPYTLFAPTDEAFSKLSKKIINDLHNDKEKLTEVFTYHLLNELMTSQDLLRNSYYTTIQGKKVQIQKTGTINNATLLQKDIACQNGIIHIIDQVLMPK